MVNNLQIAGRSILPTSTPVTVEKIIQQPQIQPQPPQPTTQPSQLYVAGRAVMPIPQPQTTIHVTQKAVTVVTPERRATYYIQRPQVYSVEDIISFHHHFRREISCPFRYSGFLCHNISD